MSNETMIIRRARREDVPAIIRIFALDPIMRELEKGPEPLGEEYFRAFEEIDEDANQLLLVAEDGGKVVGSVQLTYVRYLMGGGMRLAILEAMFMHPQCIGKGAGSLLLKAAMEAARREGCQGIELTSNKARGQAHKFYEKHGFKATHEGFKLYLTREE